MTFIARVFSVCLLTALLSQQASYATAPYTPEQVKQDFEFLYQGLQASAYDLFHRTPKTEFDKAYQDYLASFTEQRTQLQVFKAFQRFTALAQTAHTRVEFPAERLHEYMRNDGKILPVYLKITESGVFIDELYADDVQVPTGTQVIEVDGQPVMDWLAPLFSYVSADNQALLWGMTELQLPALVWLHYGEQNLFELGLASEGQKLNRVAVSTVTYSQQQALADNQDTDQASTPPPREYRMLDDSLAYLKPGAFFNLEGDNIWDEAPFHLFIDQAFTHFQSSEAKRLLIDLRGNTGGSNGFSDHMLAWFADRPFAFASDFRVRVSQAAIDSNAQRLALKPEKTDISYQLAVFYDKHSLGRVFSFPIDEVAPHRQRRFDGEVYVMVDRYSYSNAVSVAAIVKDYGFGTVIGEKTADLATTHGAMEHFTLPHTGLTVGFPKALIIRPNGDAKPDGVTPDRDISDMLQTYQGEALLQRLATRLAAPDSVQR